MIPTRTFLLQAVMALSCGMASYANAFTMTTPSHAATSSRTAQSSTTELFYNSDNSGNNNDEFDLNTLEERIGTLRLQIMEDDLLRPPNANLKPKDFVKALLEGIFYNEDPRPDAGFMLLLRCSTDQWASKVLDSIGAPPDANLETVAAALGTAIARPHNQYAILVGGDEEGLETSNYVDETTGERNFYVTFPGDTLDFLDGTAWVNVEFRSKTDNSLLVLTGWQLSQRTDGAWLVDQIEWQDYREEYWPGIGREEWMPFEGRRR